MSRSHESSIPSIINMASRTLDAEYRFQNWIERLAGDHFGRAIKMVTPEKEDKTVGIILPTSEPTKHLLLFSNGAIAVIVPASEDQKNINAYKLEFSPSEYPYRMQGNLESIIFTFTRQIARSRPILDNSNPDDKSRITEVVNDSLSELRKIKEERDQAKKETMLKAVGKLDEFFHQG